MQAEVPPSERTRIQLCGRLSIEVDGQKLEQSLRGRQVPLLLAYLLLNRSRYVGREELIGALWPERAPRSQDAALRTLLSRLRSALGAEALGGRDELILQLPEPVWIDLEAAATEVQRAQQALAAGEARTAWGLAQVPFNIAGRGLLPGVQASWLEGPRRELEETRLLALEVIGSAGLAIGGTQLAAAERAARTLIEAEPYRESAYVLLMEVLEAQGNAAEALRVFDRLRTLLREELGTSPSAESQAVLERLLHPQERRQRGGDADGGERAGPTIALPSELAARASVPLVGRAEELRALQERWARAGDGAVPVPGEGGRIVLLTGEPGIGKTRLLAELGRIAHEQGAFVLAGRSPEETLVPYQPFLEGIRHYVVGTPVEELRATVREYGAELARLVPELRRRAPGLAVSESSSPETERYRLFEAVVGLLEELSSRAPVLLALDDLHWADRPTLLLLRHLARAPHPERLLILGAYRAGEEKAPGFGEALAELRHERLATLLHVPGLGEPETAELIRMRTGALPSQSLSQALHAETEGNPLFVEELVRSLSEAGVDPAVAGPHELQEVGLPESVTDVIARRLARLDEGTLDWLRVAAVVGRDFDLPLLEQVVPHDEERFLGALDAALEAGLVAESPSRPGRYTFSHTLIRETLYAGMSAARRERIHRRVGQALEQHGAERRLGALALHFTRAAGAEDADKAIEYARRAGEQATAMLAHEEAADHYERALEVHDRFGPEDLVRRCELLLALGEARVRAGERPLGWPAFREAAELATQLRDKDLLARAAVGASMRYIQPPGVVDEELIGLLERALALIGEELSVTRVRLLARLCGALYYSSRRDEMRAIAQQATEIAQALGDPAARALAAAARRRAYWGAAHLARRLGDSTELLTCAREAGDLELELAGHAWLVVDLLEHGEANAVATQIEAFTAGAEQLGQPLYIWNVAIWRTMRALLSGRLDEAEELAGKALALGSHGETVTAPQYYALQLLAIRQEQARMAELEDAARAMVQGNPHRPAWRAALAMLLSETERPEEAGREIDVLAQRDFEDIPQDGDWLIAITLLADCCAELRDRDRAALLYELLLPYRESNVVIGLAAVCLGSASRFLGRLAAVLELREEASAHLEQALEANAQLRAPAFHAHTQLDIAELLGPGGRAQRLVAAASHAATELRLPRVARRAAALRR